MLKTTNFEVKHGDIVVETLPEAYGIIRRLVVGNNDMACAYIGVYRSKELARNHREVPPIIEKRIDFKSDRTANDRATAYIAAKTPYIEKEHDYEGKPIEVTKYPFFYGWDNDFSL
jgi:hypothetical protein